MMAFPELSKIYGTWKEEVESRGNVKVKTCTEILSVERNNKKTKEKGGNILISSQSVDSSGNPLSSSSSEEIFDELILACDADSSLKILKSGSGPTWKERQILGSVLYKWDVTVTHNDFDYMKKHYEMYYPEKFNADRNDEESQNAFKFAKENWNPLYLIKMYKEDPKKIEMSFDLTVYQPQFKEKGNEFESKVGKNGLDQRMGKENAEIREKHQDSKSKNVDDDDKSKGKSSSSPPPLDQHVFQTIFLDKEISNEWTKEEIKEDKVILERWWKQQSHRAKHYVAVVPWMWSINGKNHTK